jgi:hypothetical protein
MGWVQETESTVTGGDDTMKMQGIVVSVQYDDILELTLPHNARHFARLLVVTAPFDERTQAVARRSPNIETFVTDAFYRGDALFNKGLALELATQWLRPDMWALFFDADVVLPRGPFLDGHRVDPECVYGAPRLDCATRDQFERAICAPRFEEAGLVRIDAAPPYAALPYGYFQLFHPQARVLRTRPWYGIGSRHAGNSDVQFIRKFPPSSVRMLPFHLLHLGPVHENWRGRCSERWNSETASVPPGAAVPVPGPRNDPPPVQHPGGSAPARPATPQVRSAPKPTPKQAPKSRALAMARLRKAKGPGTMK